MATRKSASSASASASLLLNLVGVNVQFVKDRLLNSTEVNPFETTAALCAKLVESWKRKNASASSLQEPSVLRDSPDIHQDMEIDSSSVSSAQQTLCCVAAQREDVACKSTSSDVSSFMLEKVLCGPQSGSSLFSSEHCVTGSSQHQPLSQRASVAKSSAAQVVSQSSITAPKGGVIEFSFETGVSSRCDWCRLPVERSDARIGVPVSYELGQDGTHRFRVYGTCCRLQCALAQARHDSLLPVQQRRGPRYFEHLVHLLYKLCKRERVSLEGSQEQGSDVLQAAPDWRLLQANGGRLTVEQFFSDLVNTQVRTGVILEPVAQTATIRYT